MSTGAEAPLLFPDHRELETAAVNFIWDGRDSSTEAVCGTAGEGFLPVQGDAGAQAVLVLPWAAMALAHCAAEGTRADTGQPVVNLPSRPAASPAGFDVRASSFR